MRLFENPELRSYGFSCFRRGEQGCQDELEFRESCLSCQKETDSMSVIVSGKVCWQK